jgi:hypothetical protein
MGDWQTLAYADYARLWAEHEEAPPSATDLRWASVWTPSLFVLEEASLGFSWGQVAFAAEARREEDFALWLDGAFEVHRIVAALQAQGYQALEDFPAEAYYGLEANKAQELAPFIALPDGRTLLIAGTALTLEALLGVYDAATPDMSAQDALLRHYARLTPPPVSALARLDNRSRACPAEASRLVLHGVFYDPERQIWGYQLGLGYALRPLNRDIEALGEALEYSTYIPPAAQGVFGQETSLRRIRLENEPASFWALYELELAPNRPDLLPLPFELARLPDICPLFQSPPASAFSRALRWMPDLSAGRVGLELRFGNTQQALYHAGVLDLETLDPARLGENPLAAFNATWRTPLAFQSSFEVWFGWPSHRIRQTLDLTLENNAYTRLVWGDFSRLTSEEALSKSGYVALEQYQGARVFLLQTPPPNGGSVLASVALYVAVPQDGLLIMANERDNLRFALDIWAREVITAFERNPQMEAAARLLADATNLTLKRFIKTPQTPLICGLPPYRVEAFANVLRPDGWRLIYLLGFESSPSDPNALAQAIGVALENSTYPLRGPGSATFGELSRVLSVASPQEDGVAFVRVELAIDAPPQTASFFGQDILQTVPCALANVQP